MTRKEWEEELDRLAAACRSFQHAFALDEDDDCPEGIDDIWGLTEDIIRQHESMRSKA